ncbi:MAG: HAMP domain-containing histidine kinase [Candidatus Manganitrophus sp. SA1]|nr:HAMP domain-containing histidine kinase [Candidatus Manganitrophus morganii]
MLKGLNIRKRLLVFGAIWLAVCLTVLTLYFVSQAKEALLEGANKRSLIIASTLADQARNALYIGNEDQVRALMKEVSSQPDVLDVRIYYNGVVYGIDNAHRTFMEPSSFPLQSTRHILFHGLHAIEAHSNTMRKSKSQEGKGPSLFSKIDQEENGNVVVILSVDDIYKQTSKLLIKAGVFMILVLAGGVLLGWVVSGRMILPLRQLAYHVSALTSDAANTHTSDEPFRDELDTIRGGVHNLKTQLDRTSAELERSQRMTAALEERNNALAKIISFKEGFIYQLAHELINPLSSLSKHQSNFFRSTSDRLTNEEKNRYQRMQELTNRLMQMITEEELTKLLSAAVQKSGNIGVSRVQVDVTRLITQVFFTLEWLQHKATVTCVIGDSLKGREVYADPVHVEQILFNLIHNAIQVSPPGGCVVVDARSISGNLLEVRVKDSGFGIPHTLRSRLLRERVESTHQGSGQGLMICRFLVELHGGEIGYQTDKINGTIFYFKLPTSAQSFIEAGP